jgi:hypothetical protein
MGISYGPKLPDKDKLMLQVFPGVTNLYTDAFSNVSQVLPVDGNQFIGSSGPRDFDPNYYPTWEANVAHTSNTGDTYTIYSMVSVKFPPYKLVQSTEGEPRSMPVRRRKFQIARIKTTNEIGTSNDITDFRIGVICPYYRTNATGSDYKGIFAPIAFSFGFVYKQSSFSFTTDYKFNLNDWHTLAIEVHKASSVWGDKKQFRVYINGEAQNITFNRGLDWNFRWTKQSNGNYNPATYNNRANSAIHSRPGFICVNGTTKENSTMWDVSDVKSSVDNRTVSHIPKLNFTPQTIYLGSDRFGAQGNGSGRKGVTRANGVHYGPLMIYRDFYNNKVYEQFRTLNN